MSKNKDWKMFNLIKACKDCPFKKGMSYLSKDSLLGHINGLRYQDSSFNCHKTIDYDALNQLNDIQASVNEELELLRQDGCSNNQIAARRIELVEEYGLEEAIKEYNETSSNEMYCAGILILAKKAGFLMNNRALRYAVAAKLLDVNQFIDEDEVFDSVEEAVESHCRS